MEEDPAGLSFRTLPSLLPVSQAQLPTHGKGRAAAAPPAPQPGARQAPFLTISNLSCPKEAQEGEGGSAHVHPERGGGGGTSPQGARRCCRQDSPLDTIQLTQYLGNTVCGLSLYVSK